MNDKIIHFIVSLMLTVLLALWLHPSLAMAVTLAVGVLKELYDRYVKKTFFDWSDICADAFGAVFGMGIGVMIL